MGITGLNQYLKKKHPDVYITENFCIFSHEKVCIDISSYMYMYMYGKRKWLESFINLIVFWKRNYVHVIPIFDGKAPPEKAEEHLARKNAKTKSQERTLSLEKELEEKRVNFEEIGDLEEKIQKRKKGDFTIEPEDKEKLKSLFRVFKIPYIEAPCEAETLACYLCKKGLCKAVISVDSDCMAYGIPIFVNNFDMYKEECTVVYNQDLLEELEMSQKQFTLSCIIMGCDYNKELKTVKGMGPNTVVAAVKKYKEFNKIQEKYFPDGGEEL